jgi:GntR family transcriptional regulator
MPDVETPSFSPLYQQIKRLIVAALEAGEWKPGEAIPSEQELAVRFGVSQGTVRKAVDEIAADNLVVRRQGKGTFVATHAEQQQRYRFLRLVADEDGPPLRRELLDCRPARASAAVARALALPSGSPVVELRRLLHHLDQPVVLDELWLPGRLFEGLTMDLLASHDGPLYELFETRFGVHMVRAEERLRALAADETSAALLHLPVGAPLLSVERVAFTYGDKPVELRRGLYDTRAHHYRNDLN